MLRLVNSDELDAAFCLLPGEIPRELAAETLSHEDVIAAFAPDRAPPVGDVSASELARDRIVALRRGSAITTALAQRFAEAGEPLRLALESGDPFLLRQLAARGFATAILPRSLSGLHGPDLEIRGLDPAVRLPVALVWRRARDAPPVVRAFIDFVRGETDPASRRPAAPAQ
jgi:DNA-binding transcriptional LysR family regulator